MGWKTLEISRADKYNLVEGGIANKLFFISAPLMLTQVFQMAYNLTDMFWLGRLSSDAVAASGAVGLFIWMSLSFMFFGRMGAEIGVSQNLGKGDKTKALCYAQNSIFISITLGMALALIFFLGSEPFIGFLGIQEAHVANDARDYLSIVSFSMPMAFLTAAISGIFNGAGNSRISLIINGTGFMMNMILDPLLIFSAGLGIRGAGYATIIAHSTAACIALIVLLKYKNRPFEKINLFRRPEKAIIKQIIKWVLPVSIESFVFTFLAMLVTSIIATFGSGAIAASRVGSQIDSLAWLIAGGFASALTAFTGQNFGAGKWSRIRKGFRISSAIMTVWGIVIGAFLFIGGKALFEVFIPNDPDVVKMGVESLHLLALVQIPLCLEGVAAGVFRGQGKTIPPSITSVTSNLLRVAIAFVLTRYTGLGVTGVWIAFAASIGFRGTWIFIWYLVHSRKNPKEDII